MPGPDGKPDTRPLEQRDLRPLAVEWGAQSFAETNTRSTFSLATSLSNVCKLLNMELVIEDSDAVSGVWGAVGHYTIGTLAIGLVRNNELKKFLSANADLISLPLNHLGSQIKNADL